MDYKKVILIFSISLLIFITSGCKNQESNIVESNPNETSDFAKVLLGSETPILLSEIDNGNMEDSTNGYWKGGKDVKGYEFYYTSAEYVSSSHSLEIVSSNGENSSFAYWAQTFTAKEYVGKKVVLTVSTKFTGVSGDGVMFVLRGDDTELPQGSAEAFSTTQGKIKLVGESDWKTLEVKLDPVPEGIKSLTVYMLLSANKGTVYFDDLTISVDAASSPLTDLVNGDFEKGNYAPDNWWIGGSGYSEFNFEWNKDEFVSANHSVKINSDGSGDKFAFWAQTITASQVIGKKITVSVFVKARDLNGEGFMFAIRGDDSIVPAGAAEVFSTTQGKQLITGNFDWKKFEVTLDAVPENIKSLTFYFIFGKNSSGTIFIDDAALTKL